MMAQPGKFDYYAIQGFQAISLPYGAGRASMYLFLPEQRSSLRAFRRELTPQELGCLAAPLSPSRRHDRAAALQTGIRGHAQRCA